MSLYDYRIKQHKNRKDWNAMHQNYILKILNLLWIKTWKRKDDQILLNLPEGNV